jgi:hypothetical protein
MFLNLYICFTITTRSQKIVNVLLICSFSRRAICAFHGTRAVGRENVVVIFFYQHVVPLGLKQANLVHRNPRESQRDDMLVGQS